MVVLFLVLGMGATPIAGEAEARRDPKRVTRVVRETYSMPSIGVAGVGGFVTARFQSRPNERYVSFVIADITGLPPTGAMFVRSLQHTGVYWRTFCGKTKKPIEIPPDLDENPGSDIALHVHNGPSANSSGDGDCFGIATQGTITATFSNRP